MMNYQEFRSDATFLLKFWHPIKQIETCRYNAVTPGVLFDMSLWLHKVVLSKSDGFQN